MANNTEELLIPDIGGAENVDVIDVLVKPGDKINLEDPLITLEGDKATMDIPASKAGTVKALKVAVGDKVSEGSPILVLETGASAKEEPKQEKAQQSSKAEAPKAAASSVAEVRVPDIGDAHDVDVIEVLVKPGDKVNKEDALITLEGDKATMDIPAPFSGEVKDLNVKVGDKVSTDDLILSMTTSEVAPAPKQVEAPVAEQAAPTSAPAQQQAAPAAKSSGMVHAGPAVRRIAHEFDVDLTRVPATGPKSRITKDDIKNYIKSSLQTAQSGGGAGLGVAAMPRVDFSKFGPIETKALTKIQKISGANLHRNWVSIPHVTQFGEVDITEMEAFRQQEKEAAMKSGVRLTPLVFLMKAAVAALQQFPHFNASLDPSGNELILKQYYHIGVAVDTPNGLVVPVIRDVDKKGLLQLAKELGDISKKAREKGLSMAEMQGGCFSISSLGGIGGTAFTPIINAPEVAILGVSRTETKPTYIKGELQPRLMLPLSLSYDHRVIDGADGARFLVYFSQRLSDLRTLLL